MGRMGRGSEKLVSRMPAPYPLMLLTPTPAPPAGDGYLHEAKLDGWRFAAEISNGRVRLWSRGGHDWAPKLPELESLAGLGDLVLDGEMIVATPDGRADFELLTTRLNRRIGDRTPAQPVSLYVFDILRHQGQDIRNRPWSERRAILDGLELAKHSGGAARPTLVSSDGSAMHQATADIGAEGTVSKAVRSLYRGGRRSCSWLKAKHSKTETFRVAGWRPSTSSRPGGLILVEGVGPIAVATLAIADKDRQDLVDLLHRYGRRHPTGAVTIPEDCLSAIVNLPHPHPRPSPRSVRHSGPTSGAGATARYQDWLARTATMTNMTHRGWVVPPRPRSTILGCSAE